jgi:hypothetical protein
MAGCRGGCVGPGGRTATPAGALSLFPADGQIVVSFDFRKIRSTPVWQQLSQMAADDPGDRKIIQELTARTGLDPFRHIHRVIAVFPDDARQAGAFAVLFEGEALDQKRLVTYARDQPACVGPTSSSGRTASARCGPPGAPPASPNCPGSSWNRNRFVLGGGGWAEKVPTWPTAPARPAPPGTPTWFTWPNAWAAAGPSGWRPSCPRARGSG